MSPTIEPGQFDRPYIRFGHAAQTAESAPTLPDNTPPHAPTTLPGVSGSVVGASTVTPPVPATAIHGGPPHPLTPSTTVVPGRPVNVFEAAPPAPPVRVDRLDLASPAGQQTAGMRAAPSLIPRNPVAGTHTAPSGVDSRETS